MRSRNKKDKSEKGEKEKPKMTLEDAEKIYERWVTELILHLVKSFVEREGEICVEPAKIEVAAIFGFANSDHGDFSVFSVPPWLFSSEKFSPRRHRGRGDCAGALSCLLNSLCQPRVIFGREHGQTINPEFDR